MELEWLAYKALLLVLLASMNISILSMMSNTKVLLKSMVAKKINIQMLDEVTQMHTIHSIKSLVK